MPADHEFWNEALKGIWLDPTSPPRYDNPELYDQPENHDGIIYVMRGEYAIASLTDRYYQMGTSGIGFFHCPLLVLNQEGEFGAFGLPDTYLNLLLMSEVILDEAQKWAGRSTFLVVYDRKLADHFEREVDRIAFGIQRHVEVKGYKVSLDYVKKDLRTADPSDFLKAVFGERAKLIGCRFPDHYGFTINLQEMIPHLDSINSESDLLSHFEEANPSFFHGLGLEENIRQRLELHEKMREGKEVQYPICVYNSLAV